MVRRGGIIQKVFGEKIPEKITVKTGPAKRSRLSRKREAEKGTVDISRRWTNRRPHPPKMDQYENLNKDSAVSTAITMKSGMIAGVGFHTAMPDSVETPADAPDDWEHPKLTELNAYLEEINADELYELIVRTAFEKGFCPVERLPDKTFKILPPETFYIWTTKKGTIYKYTQNVGGSKVAEWKEGAGFEDILLFYRLWSPTRIYGKALVEDVADRVDASNQISDDVPDVIHKQGYPFRTITAETVEVGDIAYKQFTEKDPDMDVFIYPVLKDQLTIHTETLTPRIDFTDYVKHNDDMKAEGLNAPLGVWMKNSTEASSKTIMESIERETEKDQRYYARRFEKHIYEPKVGTPTPRHIWGPSETGLEDMTLEGVAQLYRDGAITFGQAQNLLLDLGVPIGEAQEEPPTPAFNLPATPMAPMQDQELYVYSANYKAGRITLTEALEGGRKIIKTCVDLHKKKAVRDLEITLGKKPEPLSEETIRHFTLMEHELFDSFERRLLDQGVKR